MIQDCEFFEELMTEEIDGQLSPEHRTILQGHLDACHECRVLREKLSAAQEASALLRLERTGAKMPAHVPVLIKQRLQKRPAWFGIPVWRYATGLAMIVLLIAVVFVYRNVIPSIQYGSTAGIAGTDAAYTDRQDMGAEKETTLNDSGDSSRSPGDKSAGAMSIAVATTAAASMTTANVPEQAPKNMPFVLYSGSLTDLKPIRDLQQETVVAPTDAITTETGRTNLSSIPENFFSDTLPATLTGAKTLRVLTNSGEPVRQVIIMAGFDEKTALLALDQLRQQVTPEQTAIRIETVLPVGHARLTDLLGQPLYEQLLPSSLERQLTYLLIMIGG